MKTIFPGEYGRCGANRGNKQQVAGAGCIMDLVDRHFALAAHDRDYLKLAVMVGAA